MKQKMAYLAAGLLAALSASLFLAGCGGDGGASSITVTASAPSNPDANDAASAYMAPVVAADGTFTDPTGTIRLKIPEGYAIIPEMSSEEQTLFMNVSKQTSFAVTVDHKSTPGPSEEMTEDDLELSLAEIHSDVKISNFTVNQENGFTVYTYEFSTSADDKTVQTYQYTAVDDYKTISLSLFGPKSSSLSAKDLNDITASLQILKQ